MFLLTTAECDVIWTVTLITFSLGVNGASSITNLANSQDLAPAFAGSLYGIANTVGGASGFISPYVVAYFTKEHVSIFIKYNRTVALQLGIEFFRYMEENTLK